MALAHATPQRAGSHNALRPAPRELVGLLAIAAITAVATVVGRAWPVVGAPVIAIVLGVALRSVASDRLSTEHGAVAFAKGRLLQVAIVLLGAQLSLREVADVGVRSLPVMLGTLAVCLAAARFIGQRMGIDRDLRLLIGAGTGICGASAIAAVSSTIRPRQDHVAYAISTIFVFNVAAVLVFPPLGHALGLTQQGFGLFAGTAVNDTSSVIAAAQTFGSAAEQHAVVVKLVRTLMIVPICLWLAARASADHNAGSQQDSASRPSGWHRAMRLVPGFLIAFVLVVALNSAGVLTPGLRSMSATLAPVLVVAALAGIGLSVDVRGLRRTGARPLVLGLVLWVLVGMTSLGLQSVAG